jgi:hypothetical protein
MLHQQRPTLIEPHPTNPIPPRLHQTPMPTSKTPHSSIRFMRNQRLIRRNAVLMQHLLQRHQPLFVLKDFQRHKNDLIIILAPPPLAASRIQPRE